MTSASRSCPRPVRGALLAVVALLVSTGCAKADYSAGPATPSLTSPSALSSSSPSAVVASSSVAAPSSSQSPSVGLSATPSSTPTPTPTPEAMLDQQSSGDEVRELQARLRQIGWMHGDITPNYGDTTTQAVSGFQTKRGFDATGVVDEQTWDALTAMTRPPTHDEMFNILRPGKTLMKRGAQSDQVKDLQARLKQIGWFFDKVTGFYGELTTEAVSGFQAKRAIPVTGEVDQRTLDRLRAMTHQPSAAELSGKQESGPSIDALDSRCSSGRAICVSKTSNTLRWVVNGKVLKTMDVRFGAVGTPTREGAFSVGWKSRDHVSTLYDSDMPFAMFFSGGQAVHYSSDFAARGYNGASHGCVNVRDRAGVEWLFDQVQVGDKVIVYR